MTPTQKVAAGGFAGLIATLIVGLLAAFGVAVPATVAVALAGLLHFGVAWLKREKGIDLDGTDVQ